MRFTAIVALLLFLSTSAFAGPRPVHRTVKVRAQHVIIHKPIVKLTVPRVSVQPDGSVIPDLHASAAIVYNPDTNEVIYESNSSQVRSIASITKVMTALVYMESDPDLTEITTVKAVDTYQASHTYLRPGDKLTTDDLLHLLLIASDNVAARVLARISPEGFVDRMNQKAVALRLIHTNYSDPSGLLATNVSSAFDMAHLIVVASTNQYIADIMQMPQYTFRTVAKRLVTFKSTDHLLAHNIPVMAAKTGFTNPAGFCLASLLRMKDQTIAIVVLGARTNAERFIEVENLYQWWMLHQKFSALQVQDVLPAVHLSARGISFIKRVEGFSSTPYWDVNGYAVGYGFHMWDGQKVTRHYPKIVSLEDADTEFERQQSTYEAVVTVSINSPLSQPAYDALVSIAYNLGRVNDSIIAKLSVGASVTPSDFLETATVRNRPNVGLENRRIREFVMFAGDYDGITLVTTK
jgi:D-alanyl-D-alanine endopeptidase (penicillin-binding protein 7)